MRKVRHSLKRGVALGLSAIMTIIPGGGYFGDAITAEAAAKTASESTISNDSLRVEIGDLGQISVMNIINNRTNSKGDEVNFVLPNDTSPQNNEAHQWMGEMIFSYRTSADGNFPEGREGFVEVDTNKTLAAGGSTTYSNATENLANNPYIEKNIKSDKEVEITFKGMDESAETERAMKGFDVTSDYNMDTEDGSLLWNITLENTSDKYIEFGDVGLPMPWNNKYTSIDSVYNERVTAHTFAGADSGYAYAIRCSGEGNYILFTPVPESGARIEYVDNWVGQNNGVTGERAGADYANWTSDGGGWQPGLSVYYIHSKDIQKTGRGYYTDATSLVLEPGKSKTYQFKFSAVRAGDNTPQGSAKDENNASDSVEERETNMRSVLYDSGMIDAIAVPGFQTALNMQTQLDLHYDDSKIKIESVDVQCVHENDPFDEAHIPNQTDGLVNNSRAGGCANSDSATLTETKEVNGEKHHIYNLKFGCIGNNSVRVNYKLKVGNEWVDKFTQYEFNALEELDEIVETHSDFMVNQTQDSNPESPTYGNYQDWYLSGGVDTNGQNHWGDDWSHDNINFMTMKNYLKPDAAEVESIEKYLIDYMWNNYMKYTQDSYTVANYLAGSGIYSDSASPYTRTYSEMMEATGFFNMYRIQKAYPDLIEYRETPEWYLEKAFGIYNNRIGSYPIGFYGEQQVPDMIEALRDEGMTEEADKLQDQFAKRKGTNMATAAYPYGSEFVYDNTGEEGAYAAAKALREYYPDDANTGKALANMEKAEWKTRAMRGIQPTWYHYADPVFLGGESWWNFQYTASLAGSIMDDWLRYQDNGWDTDSSAWAERVNYAAKLSNFNAVNMGQISADSVGSVSWRYTMYKGGHGAMNVNDGGTRVMNNGWNDFSGESEEGLYGSLLRISSDVVTDPIFGLVGYGSNVSKSGTSYTVTPADGVGKRINIIDDKLYVELEQDACTKAVINSKGPSFELSLNCLTTTEHLSKIKLSGAGLADGYYSIRLNGTDAGQCYVKDNAGVANVMIPEGAATATVSVAFEGKGENEAPAVKTKAVVTDKTEGAEQKIQALVPFRLESVAYDDGAPDGTLSYKWETVSAPEGGEVTLESDDKPYTAITCSRVGRYTVKLSVSDGELTTESTLQLVVGAAPDKTEPTIIDAAAVQDTVNTSVAELSSQAAADSYYSNELKYEWTVIGQPEGGNAVIADADKANARMKASMPGEYVLCLTVTDDKMTIYDEAVSSQRYVTVNMAGNVDGVERAGTILVSVGEEPELPYDMENIIYPDGTMKDSKIVWSKIDPGSYAEAGQFTVTGTVKDTDINVAVNVMVISGNSKNLALQATPAAIIDTPWDLGGVAGLNDGYEPASSRDTSHGVWHNWLGDPSSDAWVQYTWDEPVTIYQSDAYYFTDGNFAPKDVRYEYLDLDGVTWRSLSNVKGCGTELNQYNTTTFEPVTTTALKMTMSPKTMGCGVIEWKVFGFGDGSDDAVADKTMLNSLIEEAKSVDISLFAEGAQATLDAAIAEAQAVSDNGEASQADVDVATAKLARIMATLPTADSNLAYSAQPSTSYVSAWESLAGVNDSRVTGTSFNPPGPRYGSYATDDAYETITYTWGTDVALRGADIFYWYDGEEGNYTSGGIWMPESYYYEYLDSEGNWQKVANPSSYEVKVNEYSSTSFDEVVTKAIRVTMNKPVVEEDGEEYIAPGLGVLEWKVYGEAVVGDSTDLGTLVNEVNKLVEGGSGDYSAASWNALVKSLETAKKVVADSNAGQDEIETAMDNLTKAYAGLVQGKGVRNIALKATPEGICDYPNDRGGLKAMNDDKVSSASYDGQIDMWHNWNDRYVSGQTPQNAWVLYKWDTPVILESTDVYYFTDNGGIQMPETVKFEYMDNAGNWAEVPNAEGLGCEKDKYNTTTLGNIQTTALRMTMEPQLKDNTPADPAHGVGIIEWRVNGIFASELDKTELNAAIAEAEKLDSAQYTAESWTRLEEALAAAKAMAEDGGAASQAEIDRQTTVLKASMNSLVREIEIQRGALTALINIAEQYAGSDVYTEDSKAGLTAALEAAKTVAGNADATQGDIDAQVEALTEAINNLKKNVAETVNKIELEVAVAEAEKRVKDNYTDKSWKEFEAVLEEAKVILLGDAATQAQINEYAALMNQALDKLVEVSSIDKTALNAAIDEAITIYTDQDNYTEETWAVFAEALKEAWSVSAYKNASQEEVDEKTAALLNAMEGLQLKEPDLPTGATKDALKAVIEEAQNRKEEDYTADSWARMVKYLENAQQVLANDAATQEEVDTATDLLSMAIETLVAKGSGPSGDKVNKDELISLINKVSIYARNDYTEESWAPFAAALAEAQRIANDPNATQEQVDQAAAALNAAKDGLVKINPNLNLDEIRKLIAEAEKLKEKDYTPETWKIFIEALEQARAVTIQEGATQRDVDLKAAALRAAMNNLKKVGSAQNSNTGSGTKSTGGLTGDNAQILIFLIAMLISLMTMLGVFLRRKMKRPLK